MFINEVCALVGLSRKSIRFYEENGLIKPKRNTLNDYRVYSDQDVEKLKVIKFLRELDVSIRDIKLLDEGKISLQECMEERIDKITREEEKYRKIKNICFEISKSKDSFNEIDITKPIEVINILNKEGFTMRNVKSNKRKKIWGAVFSSFVFSIFFIFLVSIISYFQFTEADKMPWILYIFLIAIFMVPIIGIVYNLVLRIKEINGGEEDEASKY